MALGWANPLTLLEQLPAPVWRLWQAYSVLEPWRLEDEPARTYPPPARAEVVSTLQAAMRAAEEASKDGVQHRQAKRSYHGKR